MNLIRDPLDELLKADAARHRDQYIDDAGFTLRVVDALPPRRAKSRLSSVVPLAFACIAAVFVTLFAGGSAFIIDAVMDLATRTITQSVIAFAVLAAVLFLSTLAAARAD